MSSKTPKNPHAYLYNMTLSKWRELKLGSQYSYISKSRQLDDDPILKLIGKDEIKRVKRERNQELAPKKESETSPEEDSSDRPTPSRRIVRKPVKETYSEEPEPNPTSARSSLLKSEYTLLQQRLLDSERTNKQLAERLTALDEVVAKLVKRNASLEQRVSALEDDTISIEEFDEAELKHQRNIVTTNNRLDSLEERWTIYERTRQERKKND